MIVFTLAQTVALPDLIDSMVSGHGDTVVVQIELELVAVDLVTGQYRSFGMVEPGSQLIVAGPEQRMTFDNAGNVVYSDAAGVTRRTIGLGEEVEFVAARSLGSRLILLLAESVGDAFDLGVPHFGLVSLDEQGNVEPLTHRWRSAPDLWFLNAATDQLVVFPSLDAERPLVIEVATGAAAVVPPGLAQIYRNYGVTGMDVSADGRRLAVSLWHEEKQQGELRVAPIDRASTKLVHVFSNDSGLPTSPAWAPDGQSFAFRLETDDGKAIVHVASPGEDDDWQIRRLTAMDPLGALFWQGGRLVVQTGEAEIAVFEVRESN